MSANEFKIIGKDLFESEKIAKPSMTFWQDVIRRIKMNKVATISFWIIVALTIMAIAGPFMSKFSYREQNLENQFLHHLQDYFPSYKTILLHLQFVQLFQLFSYLIHKFFV